MPEQLSLKSPLAIMGDEDVVLGFRALGLRTYVIENRQEVGAALEELARENNAVCLVQDNIYSQAKAEFDIYKTSPFPVFIPFAKNSDTALLDTMVRQIRLRATGTF